MKGRVLSALIIAGGLVALTGLASFSNIIPPQFNFFSTRPKPQTFDFSEGPAVKATITAGPFDLHRKYRSMEGPYVSFTGKVGDIIASKNLVLPQSMVQFVEGGVAASMTGGGKDGGARPEGLVDTSSQPRKLLWLKGLKLEVLDENDKPLPTAEFICHYNLDVNRSFRDQAFPQMEKCPDGRLVTITQGQTEITFPEGYAVPVASDEKWDMVFQAANRTTLQHRCVKHRLSLYFIQDADLVYPVTALNWYAPYVRVLYDQIDATAMAYDKATCPSCLGLSRAVNAPNNTPSGVSVDPKGRRISGHWVVPPGVHTYASTTEDDWAGFSAKDRIVHAVWSHVHPLCTDLALYKCVGQNRQLMFDNHAQTTTQQGLEITNIDYLSSKEGIVLPMLRPRQLEKYELVATYNNTTGKPQDSMSVAGIFFEDPGFSRPEWANQREGYSCMVGAGATCKAKEGAGATTIASAATVATASTTTQAASTATQAKTTKAPQKPLFDARKDGPLLKAKTLVDINTTAGVLHLELDPALAPMTCTQLTRLFRNGVFDGTTIYRYEPEFVLQLSNAEEKASGLAALTEKQRSCMRRIPLEVACQKGGKISHTKYVLSMARFSDTTDNAESSFSIVLGPSHHLDHEFAIFGHLIDDKASNQTINKIEHNWSPTRYWVVNARVRQS